MISGVVALVAGAGCPGDDGATSDPMPPRPVALAEADAWTRVADADDLFAAHRPGEVECPDDAFGTEDLGATFEVRTGTCNYLTVTQPTLAPISVGSRLELEVFHYALEALEAPQTATGHVGLGVAGTVVWETTVPIPSEPGFVEADVVIDRDVPEGAPVQFHLHNHGVNDWLLVALTVTAAG
jgi:hypothetical protein